MRQMRVLFVVLVVLAGLALPTIRPHAATVTTCDYASLATAFSTAPAGDTITFACTGPIVFTGTITVSTNNLTLNGGSGMVLDGNHLTQLFNVPAGITFHITNLTLQNGENGEAPGGAISSFGTLTVSNSTFYSNHSRFGGAISNRGALTVTNSTFSTNYGEDGAAIYHNVANTLIVTNSTFYNNNASGRGGAIHITYGADHVASVSNSTFVHHNAQYGGALYNRGTLTVANSTFSGNQGQYGGAIHNRATATVTNTITTGSTGGDCDNVNWAAGSIQNLTDDAACTGRINSGASANLQALASNGGPTQTMALGAGSTAIATGDSATCSAAQPGGAGGVDQRGQPRKAACDIGAYETQGTPGATHLVFTVQPSNTAAGANISPAVQVAAQDAGGSTVASFTGAITVAIGTNPGGGSLSGTTTVNAVAGVATFSNLSINNAGVGYTLTAAATGLTGATSNPFNITAPGATHLVFTVQPTSTAAGANISPAVQVAAQDAGGNTVASFTGAITVAIGTNPSSGTLSGTTTVNAVAGVAIFNNLSINVPGTGYTLTAAATGLTGATSNPFNITAGTATHLVFTVQPSNTVAGSIITPAVQVTAQDAGGNTATSFNGAVTVAIGTNPSSGTLSGTLTVNAVAGVAIFNNLSINAAGTGYTLTAAATGLTGATSNPFNITAAGVPGLAFTVQPSNTATGAIITPAVQVTARDAGGNPDTGFTGAITVAIGTNPGSGTLSGTLTVNAVAGVAVFNNLSINAAGTGYTLTASATGFTGATSNPFNITGAGVPGLAFTVQPSNVYSNVTMTPAVRVAVLDAGGSVVTTDNTTQITLAIGNNPSGGTLTGGGPVTVVNGVATFPGIRIDNSGNGYTLVATSNPVVNAATSVAFNVRATRASALPTAMAPMAYACDFSGITFPYFRGSVPVSAVPQGTNLYCGPLTDPAQYGVPDRPVLHAVEITALGLYRSVTRLNGPITVCLQGQGQFLYRDATGMPRVVVELPSWTEGGFTCAQIPNAGTILLAAGTASQVAFAPAGPSEALDFCTITTTAILNLRAAPSADSAVLELVPYLTTLKSSVRQGNWFQVVYGSHQGWLTGQFVQMDGYCGQ